VRVSKDQPHVEAARRIEPQLTRNKGWPPQPYETVTRSLQGNPDESDNSKDVGD
jgi:hypothetical protein